MPLPRQAMGRPGTPVIPANWATAPAAVIGKTLQSKVRIGPAGGGTTWDEGLGQTVTADVDMAYIGPATLMLVSDTARALTVVEDPLKTRVYDVTLPYDKNRDDVIGDPDAIQVGHVITVDTEIIEEGIDADPTFPAKQLRVHAIERGSRRFSRVLLASLLD